MNGIDRNAYPRHITDSYKNKNKITANPSLIGMSKLVREISYADYADDLVMDIIQPWQQNNIKYPAVVFVQGCAWTTPDRDYMMPQLCELSQRGFVVATISHRDATVDHKNMFPAFLIDIRTAIRYLRLHADLWNIDVNNIGIWGTSSGGNAALLTALTENDPHYTIQPICETETPTSDAVSYVVACFAPTDIISLIDLSIEKHSFDECREPLYAVLGATPGMPITNKNLACAIEMSPYRRVISNRNYPPILLLHGTNDSLIPYTQSTTMYDQLISHGYDASLVLVNGADHDETFWSNQVLQSIFHFIEDHSSHSPH